MQLLLWLSFAGHFDHPRMVLDENDMRCMEFMPQWISFVHPLPMKASLPEEWVVDKGLVMLLPHYLVWELFFARSAHSVDFGAPIFHPSFGTFQWGLGSKHPHCCVPIRAFGSQPTTRFASLSNSWWYTWKVPYCLIWDNASLKSSYSIGPNWANILFWRHPKLELRTILFYLCTCCNHWSHWLTSPSRWEDALVTLSLGGVPWYSKNWTTWFNHLVRSSVVCCGKSGLTLWGAMDSRPESSHSWWTLDELPFS